jgi:multidrug efflux pump
MRISELSIKRPVLATVMNLIIVLLGLVAYQRLQLREYPNIDVPTISVATFWRGASAEIMETQVTKILEDSVSGIEGIDYISSTTRSEQSNINITFKLTRNADDAAADVRDRVGRVRDQLPDEVDEPLIAKTQADATPIIYLALASDTVDPMEVTDIADRVVQDRLQTLQGVASVEIYGQRKFSMRIWLDTAKLAAYSLTPEDISAALLGQNLEVPGGRIEGPEREFTVLTESDLKTPEQFRAIILRQDGDTLVRLGDVARVELGPADERVIARHNNRNAVALGVVKQATANPLVVSNGINEVLPQINKLLPQGVTLSVAYDSTVFIDASINSVFQTILEAIAFVALVILVFLRSVRAAFIPLITIPISLLGALVIMLALGFSINTLTLLAFVLAIGLVVDDAIVMLENISRHIDEGMKPMDAALYGSKEIGFAVVAMTLTLAAVFAPIGLAEGRTGKLFSEFALALAGAVLVSGFIALTLTPMLCAKLLKPSGKPHVEPAYVGWYREKLVGVLANPSPTLRRTGLSFAVTLIMVVGGASLFNSATFGLFSSSVTSFQQLMAGFKQMAAGELQGPPPPAVMAILQSNSPTIPLYFMTAKPLNLMLSGLPRELSPTEDRGFFVGVGFAPEGSTIDHTQRYAGMIEQLYTPIPERHMHFVVTGFPVVNQMLSFVVMKDWAERERSVRDITSEVGPKMFGIPGLLAFAANPPSLGQDFLDAPVTFILQTTGSWAELDKVTQALIGKASTNPGLQSLRGNLDLNKPELRVRLNRDKVAAVGANVAEIGSTLELMLGGRQVTRFKRDGEQYDVILQLDDAERREPSNLTGIFVRNRTGEMIQLANLVDVVETVTPKELNHFNKLRAATITATLAPGYSLGEALSYLDNTLTELNTPSISADYGAASREFMQSSSTIVFVFVLALIFIFLVLAAQFESFIDPLIILFTVPLAAFGALVAMAFTGIGANLLQMTAGLGAAVLLFVLARQIPRQRYNGVKYAGLLLLTIVLYVASIGVGASMLHTNSLNIYSQIGLIALVGLIAKNGILIVEFANQLQERGADKLTAITQAATQRLRPIVMTSLATVMGAVPLALAAGAGAEARQTIGWVIVGGMTVGTLFTLFVIPVMYMKLARVREHSAA